MTEEQDPTIRVNLSFEMTREDADWLIQEIGARAMSEVRFGQGRLDMKEVEQQELLQQVSIQAARNFYHKGYEDESPSAFATKAMRAIGRAMPEEDLIFDRKGQMVGIAREAWDREVGQILAGTGIVRLGPKSRDFITAFNTWLPSSL